jgi:hypothetical protein
LYLTRLTENPVCLDEKSFCKLSSNHQEPYATNLGLCGAISCPFQQSSNPVTSQKCACTSPFQGLMIFRAPAFSDVTNPRTFQPLESTLAEYLRSVALYSVQSDTVIIASGTDFNRSDVSKYTACVCTMFSLMYLELLLIHFRCYNWDSNRCFCSYRWTCYGSNICSTAENSQGGSRAICKSFW